MPKWEGQATFVAGSGNGEVHKTPVPRQTFDWENNEIGLTDKIFPPFEPVKQMGNRVQVVIRCYQKRAVGLWSSVKARSNRSKERDRELLSAPIHLRVVGNERLKGEGDFTHTEDR